MKKLLLLLLMFVFVTQAFSQKKKKTEEILIDSLTNANTELSVQMDSMSNDLDIYIGMYATVKDLMCLSLKSFILAILK